jgi:hypothetical protein
MRASFIESEGLYPQTKRPDPALRNLAIGILLQAFRDVVSPKKSSNREWELWQQDAMDWFASDEFYPGSFKWVCEMLQATPRDFRVWLENYKRSDPADRKEMARKLIRFQIRH